MACINCGQKAEENFCPSCGQRTTVKRITLREGWNDFWSRVYGFDGMFPRTIRDLTLRPGMVTQKYIDGNRVQYYGPVGYFFWMITLYLLLLSFSDIDIKEFIRQNQQMVAPAEQSDGQKRFSQLALEFVGDHIKWITFIIMPFNALAARYILFRKSKLNLMEHMVAPFYISGHLYWLSVLTVPLFLASGANWINNVVLLFMLFYFGFTYSQLMQYQSKWRAFLKGALVPVLGQVSMMIVVSLIVIGVLLVMKYISPETFELLLKPK